MPDKKDTPIYSARDDDAARAEISDFVIALAERVDTLQDAEWGAGLEPLLSLANALASDAQRFGFEVLAEAALRVAEASAEQKPDAAQQGMIELTDIARRIRLGHRGAA
jgi:hypothetical protein